ncbi:unnamed protein product [Calicophoron daubneyi]|uniref:Uncharacterized protein n=1 Tax=Calicophoron daubneyi TaxID=300641 RepID=A0AAV2TFT0_CALDB
MLGFTPRGIPILNSARRSSLPCILSSFNCTGKVLPPKTLPSNETFHLGVCSFTNVPPEDCKSPDRQTSIICLEPPQPFATATTTTPIPNYATMAPVDCSKPSSSSIRLIGGSDRAGRVEVKHPETGTWGTICADGFNINAARTLCRMLCTSADNLQYAYPVLYNYGIANDSTPILLARITCPPNATNLNECNLGGGWGSVGGCTHAMDVGLQCGPPVKDNSTDEYTPQLVCGQRQATVRYAKDLNPDLTPSMLSLSGEVSSTCSFNVTNSKSFIEAKIPFEGCGGSLSLSNSTTIAIGFELIRRYMAAEDGLITNLPVRFSLTCLIPRDGQIHVGHLVSRQVITKLSSGTNAVAVALQLFRDPQFTIHLSQPLTVIPGESVQALVSLNDTESWNKLILQKCWATADPNRNSPLKQDLIVDRCAAYKDLRVLPVNRSAVGFSFPAFYLGRAGSVVPDSTNLYLHCDTRICGVDESIPMCRQFCQSPVPTLRRRRRSVSITPTDDPGVPIRIEGGDISVEVSN